MKVQPAPGVPDKSLLASSQNKYVEKRHAFIRFLFAQAQAIMWECLDAKEQDRSFVPPAASW